MFDAREGALTQLYLATSPDVESKNIKGLPFACFHIPFPLGSMAFASSTEHSER
jgi:hypothetical protein